MKEMEHIKDTIIHKTYILQVGLPLVKYLEDTGRTNEAFELGKRLIAHDNSKITDEEIQNFIKIEDIKGMEDPNAQMNDMVKEAVKLHWKNNRHHPEHFNDYHNMNEIDIMEMCCDWCARSKQNKTDLIDFINIRRNNRFYFDDDFFAKVCSYCELLLSFLEY